MTERTPDDARAEARIEAALCNLGADQRPPLGWQARVLASAPRPSVWRRWWAGRAAAFTGALAAAAVLALVVIWRPWRPDAASPELAVLVDRQGGATRGGAAHVGDVLRVSARHGPGHRAIWIYRGDEPLLACPGGPGCSDADGALAAEIPIDLVGTYTVVALWSASPIAAPAGTRDEALAAAERGGAGRRVESIVVN